VKIVKDDFRTKTTSILLKKDESRSIEIDPDGESRTAVNKITITAFPEKARIYLDSDFIGNSPLQIENLAEGSYRLRVDMQGYVSKYRTLKIKNNINMDISVTLEKGSNKESYLTRAPVYNYLFKGSLFGCAAGIFSFIYLGMKIEDEKAKVRGFTYDNPSSHTAAEEAEYARLKKQTDDRVDRLTFYKNISAYSAAGFLISAGIFYYLDISQYDIDIALYNPDFSFPQCYNSHDTICYNWQDFGVRFSLRF
jgi:hypothetical protein